VVVVPLVANVPLQPPDAAQLLALVALHCSVTDVPIATLVSLDLKVTNGAAAVVGASAPLDVCGISDVCAFELAPHATSELSAANASIDFNPNATLE
jgi:hypothetical protein